MLDFSQCYLRSRCNQDLSIVSKKKIKTNNTLAAYLQDWEMLRGAKAWGGGPDGGHGQALAN